MPDARCTLGLRLKEVTETQDRVIETGSIESRKHGRQPRATRCGPPGVHNLRQSRAFTALRLINIVTAVHSHMNELATLEFALQQLARLEDELAPDGAVPGPLMLALSSRTRIGTVERANAIAAATLPAEAQRRLTVLPIEITTGYRRPDGQWPPRYLARFTPAGDLKPVECIHSVLGILEAKASQG